jgi:hypothetical protein
LEVEAIFCRQSREHSDAVPFPLDDARESGLSVFAAAEGSLSCRISAPAIGESRAFAGDDTEGNQGLFNCRSRSITLGGLL